jgi:hypothetical protein
MLAESAGHYRYSQASVLGCLWITNTWGVPLATVTAGLILLARPRSSIRMTVVQGALILSAAAFVAFPFQANYVPGLWRTS